MDELERGTQIAYVPMHAEGDIFHPDVQYGFVASGPRNGAYFCRYWSKHSPGELRTKANSELTPIDCLRLVHVCTQDKVEAALEEFC